MVRPKLPSLWTNLHCLERTFDEVVCSNALPFVFLKLLSPLFLESLTLSISLSHLSRSLLQRIDIETKKTLSNFK